MFVRPSRPDYPRRIALTVSAALLMSTLVAVGPPASAAVDLCATPTQADFFQEGDTVTSVEITSTNPDTCLRTYRLDRLGGSDVITEIAGTPIVRTGSTMLDAMYAMALEEAREDSTDAVTDGSYFNGASQDCTADGVGCFYTGRNWPYVWTRDVSYASALGLSALEPVRMRNTLDFKLSERRSGWYDDLNSDGTVGKDLQIIQDSGTGGGYPNSTDRVSWSLGSDEIIRWLPDEYRQAFQDRSYEAVSNTVEHDRQVVFDTQQNLYSGETSFLDWRWQTYPQWIDLDMTQVAQSLSLSTNVTHWIAIDQAARFASDAGDTAKAKKYRSWADDLAQEIRTKFWLPQQQQFAAVISGTLDPTPTLRYDALGTALVILSGIATPEQAAAAIRTYPNTVSGPPVIWPQQPHISSLQPQQNSSYHNEAAWPFVTAFMLFAAAQVGNDTALTKYAESMLRTPMLYGSNYENVNITTGGTDTAMNSERQLWSLAGMLGMFQHVFFGVKATDDGLVVSPTISAQIRHKYIPGSSSTSLFGLEYRGRVVNVEVKLPTDGAQVGNYQVLSTTVNGQTVPNGNTISPDQLGGVGATANITVELGTPGPSQPSASNTDVTNHEFLYGPQEPLLTSLDHISDTRIELGIDLGSTDVAAVSMDVVRDGEVIATDIPAAQIFIDEDASKLTKNSYCYSVRLKYRSSGNSSQPSNPICYWGEDNSRIIINDSAQFEHTGGAIATKNIGGRTRTYIKDWGMGTSDSLTSYVEAPVTGTYLAQVQYATAAVRDVRLGVSSGIKMLTVIDDATGEVVTRKPVVLSNRATWDVINGSTYVPVELSGGKKYRIVVSADRLAVNMGYFKANETYKRTSDEDLTSGPRNFNDIYEMRLYLKQIDKLRVQESAQDRTVKLGTKISGQLLTVSPGAANQDTDMTASVNWGDGSSDDAAVMPAETSGFEISGTHTYAKPGTYHATVTVSDGYEELTESLAITVIRNETAASTPAITGRAQVGGELSAVTGYWAPGTQLSWRWMADGVVIPGAHERTLPVTASLLGKRISVAVTAKASDGQAKTLVSKQTSAVAAGIFASATRVRIQGKARAGKKLRAVISSAKPGKVTIYRQWIVGKKKLKSTKKAIKVKRKWAGKKIRLRVTTSKPGYRTTVTTSKPVRIKKTGVAR